MNPPGPAVRRSFPVILLTACAGVGAQPNRIDRVHADAPELAAFGPRDIGVRTIELVDADRADALRTPRDGPTARYDRALTVEVWYPAALPPGQAPGGRYRTFTRNPDVVAELSGRAVRDAAPAEGGPWPLVILSHGYPGNRYLMSHMAENLASKGYVVASIDHADSTYDDQRAFASTLYNRPLDQRFVLDRIAALSALPDGFLSGLADADSTGIVGYSMGGYGLVNNAGGGYSDEAVDSPLSPPNGLLGEHAASNPRYRDGLDSRLNAGVAVAPWGMNLGFWRAEDLAGVAVPMLFVAGSADAVSGYADGTRAIFERATGGDRHLLTFKNAGHNAGAPIPLPAEIADAPDQTGAGHYTDPVWDTVRMNNILNHFVTAWFDWRLKGEDAARAWLDVVPDGADAVHAMRGGRPAAEHNYWKGFAPGTAVGLVLERRRAGE